MCGTGGIGWSDQCTYYINQRKVKLGRKPDVAMGDCPLAWHVVFATDHTKPCDCTYYAINLIFSI